jgi:hypothetical protein
MNNLKLRKSKSYLRIIKDLLLVNKVINNNFINFQLRLILIGLSKLSTVLFVVKLFFPQAYLGKDEI